MFSNGWTFSETLDFYLHQRDRVKRLKEEMSDRHTCSSHRAYVREQEAHLKKTAAELDKFFEKVLDFRG